jgi:peptide/nickel transport system permease protein
LADVFFRALFTARVFPLPSLLLLHLFHSITIIFKHIIPQISSLLIVSVALSIPGFIMTETVLSYLGLGITDPAVSWGSLIKRDLSTLANLQAFQWLLSPVWFLLGRRALPQNYVKCKL